MRASRALVLLILGGFAGSLIHANEFEPADALAPEQMRLAINRLNDPLFRNREAAAVELFQLGGSAISALEEAARGGVPEVSVRAFDVLVRLYRQDDEAVYLAAEKAMRGLIHADNLVVAARAERVFATVNDIRRIRGIAKFKQLGGVFHDEEGNAYVLLDREWKGGDDGARLIECFSGTHDSAGLMLIIVEGAMVSDEVLLELSLEMPRLAIQRRGLARLGVKSNENREGCVITGVEPGSAAERAGLQVEDHIIEIDGHVIETFSNLVDVIKKKEPGNQVPIVFIRGDKTYNVVAELLPWR